jgi:hypothetical protein
MPRLKLTKSAIDALQIPGKDTVYWDSAPGFGSAAHTELEPTPEKRSFERGRRSTAVWECGVLR